MIIGMILYTLVAAFFAGIFTGMESDLELKGARFSLSAIIFYSLIWPIVVFVFIGMAAVEGISKP